MRGIFRRSEKRLSESSSSESDGLSERRSSIFRRRSSDEIVEMMRPRDTLVTRLSREEESPKESRRRLRRGLVMLV